MSFAYLGIESVITIASICNYIFIAVSNYILSAMILFYNWLLFCVSEVKQENGLPDGM